MRVCLFRRNLFFDMIHSNMTSIENEQWLREIKKPKQTQVTMGFHGKNAIAKETEKRPSNLKQTSKNQIHDQNRLISVCAWMCVLAFFLSHDFTNNGLFVTIAKKEWRMGLPLLYCCAILLRRKKNLDNSWLGPSQYFTVCVVRVKRWWAAEWTVKRGRSKTTKERSWYTRTPEGIIEWCVYTYDMAMEISNDTINIQQYHVVAFECVSMNAELWCNITNKHRFNIIW